MSWWSWDSLTLPPTVGSTRHSRHLSQWLMNLLGFQKELGEIPETMQYVPLEALAATWNQRMLEALNRIALMCLLLTHQPPHSPRFSEELKRVNDKSIIGGKQRMNPTNHILKLWLRHTLCSESSEMSVFLCTLHPQGVAQWPCSGHLVPSWGKVSDYLLQGLTEAFVQHLIDRIIQIHSWLELSLVQFHLKCPGN